MNEVNDLIETAGRHSAIWFEDILFGLHPDLIWKTSLSQRDLLYCILHYMWGSPFIETGNPLVHQCKSKSWNKKEVTNVCWVKFKIKASRFYSLFLCARLSSLRSLLTTTW